MEVNFARFRLKDLQLSVINGEAYTYQAVHNLQWYNVSLSATFSRCCNVSK